MLHSFWRALDLVFAIVVRRKHWVLVVQCGFCGDKTTVPNPEHRFVTVARKRTALCHRCHLGRVSLVDLFEVDEATEVVTAMMANLYAQGAADEPA